MSTDKANTLKNTAGGERPASTKRTKAGNKAEALSYEKAFEELKEIATQMEAGLISVDLLAAKVTRASELLLFCQEKLRKTESDVNQVIKNLDASKV